MLWANNFTAPREPTYSTVNFRHIGGYEEIKEALRLKMLYPLKNPDLARAYGSKTGGSVLLYGPSGCGKSLMAEAIAGECHAGYIHVGLHELLDPTLGSPERNLHQLFDFARSNTPAILVIDHVECLAMNRKAVSDMRSRYIVNQLLEELDFCIPGNEGLLVVGITDEPWAIDPAALRPGRFSQTLFMGAPDRAQRETIIRLVAAERPVTDIDVLLLAEKTKGFTGADLEALFNTASESCMSRAWSSGDICPVSMSDLLAALKQVSLSEHLWKARAEEMIDEGSFNSSKSFKGLEDYLGSRE